MARIAVVHPYWDFWAGSTSFDLEASRERLAASAAQHLAPHGEIVWRGLLDAARVETVIADVLAARAEVVVVVQSMATPPAVSTALLDALPGAPVVIWALRTGGGVGTDFDHGDITAEGATVGTPMLTSVLVRTGRAFDLVTATLDDEQLPTELGAALGAASAAVALRGARIGRVGSPIAGYDCVDLDEHRLRDQLGAVVVPLEPAEILARYREVGRADADATAAWIRGSHRVGDDVTSDELDRVARSWCALQGLVADHALDAGAFNCHVPEIRLGADLGIAPCFALGCSTSEGVPWTCAGDVVTAVAMLVAKRLGAAALYHELEAFDRETGVFVVANSGEHDRDLAPGTQPQLAANPWYPGPPRSLCARLTAAPGPASLLGFVQLDDPAVHRLVVAAGEFVAGGFPATGTANAAFRFTGAPAPDAWRQWCLAGVNHHAVASPGDLRPSLRRLASHLGIALVEI